MPDFFGLPDSGDSTQWFNYIGGTTKSTSPEFQTWTKPRGIIMVYMTSIDPGSGGGGGFSGATSTQRGGGGGGISGVIASCLIPAAYLPDVLYIFVAPGALGGAAGVAGANPSSNNICVSPVSASGGQMAAVLNTGTAGTGGGGAGTATIGGGHDNAESSNPVSYSSMAAGIGIHVGCAAQAGVSGGASGAGVGWTMSNMISCLTAGGGGAGCTSGNVDSAGGGITASAFTPWSPNGIPGGLAGGGRGGDGISLSKPMFFTGGGGGGSNSAGVGGRGGDGATGCGGGGGGGGITGGAGGNGGNGLVIITCW